MDWNLHPRRSPGIEISEVTDGFVVSHVDSGHIHYLNAAAAFILECCDGKLRAGELPGLLALAFNLEHSPVLDVEECLKSLHQQGLLIEETFSTT
jgi:hypothetical protein